MNWNISKFITSHTRPKHLEYEFPRAILASAVPVNNWVLMNTEKTFLTSKIILVLRKLNLFYQEVLCFYKRKIYKTSVSLKSESLVISSRHTTRSDLWVRLGQKIRFVKHYYSYYLLQLKVPVHCKISVYWGLALIKLQVYSLRSSTLLKRDSGKGGFLWLLVKFFTTAFFCSDC